MPLGLHERDAPGFIPIGEAVDIALGREEANAADHRDGQQKSDQRTGQQKDTKMG